MKNNMNNIKFTIIVLLHLCFASNTVVSQIYLSLDSAQSMAIRNNTDIQTAKQTHTKAELEKQAAYTKYLPKVSAQATGLYIKNNFEKEIYLPTMYPNPATGELYPNIAVNPQTLEPILDDKENPIFNLYSYLPLEISLQGAYMAGLFIEQPIYMGGKIKAGNSMAEKAVLISKDNIALQRSKTIIEINQAYLLCIAIQSKITLAQKNVEMLSKLLERITNSYKTGYCTYNDVLKVQIEYDKAQLELQKAESGLQLSNMALCRIIGLDLYTPLIYDTIIPIDTLIWKHLQGTESIQKRPEYSILQNKIAYKEQELKMTRATYLPTIGLKGGYTHIGGIQINSQDYSNSNVQFIVSVNIPLFAWTEGKQKLASAQIDIKNQELELEKNSELMKLELEKTKQDMKHALTQIRISEKAVAQSQENLRITQNNYIIGKIPVSDVLTAQTLWQQASTNLIQSKIDYANYVCMYKKLIGIL